MSTYFDSIAQAIGQTPLVKLNRISPKEGGNIFAKVEFLNPGGSIKDRTALGMIEAAEEAGQLKPGATIIEPTAGNTGIGLAVVAAAKGYRLVVVMPEGYSEEKRSLMRGLGAELVMTPQDDGIQHAIKVAQNLAETTENSFCPQQFANPANPDIHYQTTAPEIEKQMGSEKVDVVVIGAGTGGTFTGVVKYFREKNPDLKAVLVEPQGSIFGGGEPGKHMVEGIGNSFIPGTLEMELADEIVMVHDPEAFKMVDRLAAEEGIVGGGSSGANVQAAWLQAQQAAPGTNIITVLPDSAERYFSKYAYQGEI